MITADGSGGYRFMFAYLVRRIAYALPILLGVNFVCFSLFFWVNTPDKMARTILGDKFVNQEAVDNWKEQHGYNWPLIFNKKAKGAGHVTDTIFWKKSMSLFVLDFGKSDRDDAAIAEEVKRRLGPSLSITVPMFLISLVVNVFLAMIFAFYRGSYIDTTGLIVCVCLMSISILFYILGGQFLLGKLLHLVPISGFADGWERVRFLILPVAIGVVTWLGGSVRFYRTLFLEEINKDYIRTARAKGLDEKVVLFKHALKNAMIPILTSVSVTIPLLIMGNLLLEQYFAIPGLGRYTIEAISTKDFAIVRSMVFLGSVLYIVTFIVVDVAYTLVDPRIRLG